MKESNREEVANRTGSEPYVVVRDDCLGLSRAMGLESNDTIPRGGRLAVFGLNRICLSWPAGRGRLTECLWSGKRARSPGGKHGVLFATVLESMNFFRRLFFLAFAWCLVATACDPSSQKKTCDPDQRRSGYCFSIFMAGQSSTNPGWCGDVGIDEICGPDGWHCPEETVPNDACTCGGNLRGRCESRDAGSVRNGAADRPDGD